MTIAFATASVGVGVVAPDALPMSPFTSSHVVSLPPPATSTSKPAAPVNPSIVASANPSAPGLLTPPAVAPPSTTPTMPRADESTASTSSAITTGKTATTTRPTALPSSVYYENCEAVWKAGAAPLRVGQPGYRIELDIDHNGVACEKRP
ncbi:MAG: excalibur calcium-binding domain-containing protein [Propionibacteriaceae bacterium]